MFVSARSSSACIPVSVANFLRREPVVLSLRPIRGGWNGGCSSPNMTTVSQCSNVKGIFMRVLLKVKGEDRYLASPGGWTENDTEAKDFKSLLPVVEYLREHKLENVEAFFRFDDPKYNFVLRLG